jgi:cell division protein FtsW
VSEGSPSLLGALRLRRGTQLGGSRFLDRPFASVQLLILAAGGMLVFGVLMAVSTTIAAGSDDSSGAPTGSIWSQSIKEAEFVLIGLLVFWFAVRLSPRALRVLTYPALAIAMIALVAVLVPGIGVQVYGSTRWIDIGPLQLQPSELAKVAMLLWGADLLARKQQLGTLRRARHLFVPLLPGFLVVSLLVMAEPDLGTTACFVLILLGLLWMIGMPLRYFILVVGMAAAAVAVMAVTVSWRLQRLTAFLHPFSQAKQTGYQTVEGLYALASGGFFGVGLGQGTSKYGWVPNASSDFVFAIIGEELGLIGCLAVLVLFAMLAYAGMRIARRSADPFARLCAGAATIWLCGQAVINVGYVTGLVPVTGIPLPLISAGGTSLIATMFVVGMLVSFARHESAAVTAARRAQRTGSRTRAERWLGIPVPRQYAPPRRRRQSGGVTRAASNPSRVDRRATSSRAKSPAGRSTATRPQAGRRVAVDRTKRDRAS